ncbi:phage protein NinX family protein [Pseudomonas sp. NFACC09-4]|uniref:phage protein NinX family protein n=1 Tax=Pseudomonas sp. NFACC09-4 TaxID=1566237 RepID=UPI0009FB1416|nr:phage protein NinX family protein [Pseudomonas sp. NFACC09-4]
MSDMIEMKTAELEGVALDWAVAIALHGKVFVYPDGGLCPPVGTVSMNEDDGTLWTNIGEYHHGDQWRPSADWNQCGPLIEKTKIGFGPVRGGWVAHPHRPNAPTEWLTAEDPLVAICRAIVADKIGMAVSIPAELI